MASDPTAVDREVAEHAAQWLVMLFESKMRPKAQKEFAAWLKASPRHAEEFLLAMAVWMELDALDPKRVIDLRKLLDAR